MKLRVIILWVIASLFYLSVSPIESVEGKSELAHDSQSLVSFVKTIPFYKTLGAEPVGIGFDAQDNRVYIANSASHTISIVDSIENQILGEIDIGNSAKQPVRIAIVMDKAYIACLAPPNILILNLSTNQPIRIINLDGEPLEIASDTQNDYIYTLSKGSLSIIDANNDNLVKKLSVPQDAQDIAVNPNTGKVYIAGIDLTVLLPDGTLTQIPQLSLSDSNSQFRRVAVNPNTNRIYVIQWETPNIFIVDGETDSLLSTMELSSDETPTDIDVDPQTDQIFICYEGHMSTWGWSGGYIIIDGKSNQPVVDECLGERFYELIAVNPTTGFAYIQGPSGISVIKGTEVIALLPKMYSVVDFALNPITRKLYILGEWARPSFVIDLNSGKVDFLEVDNLPNPHATASTSPVIDPVNNRIYVGNTTGGGWSGNAGVVVIDGEKDEIDTGRWDDGRIALGSDTEILAVDPKSNKIYAKEEWKEGIVVIDAVTGELGTLQGPIPSTAVRRHKTIRQVKSPVTNRIYKVDPNAGMVTIWDNLAKQQLGEIKVGGIPSGIEFDREKHLYIVDSRGDITILKEIGSAKLKLASVEAPDSSQLGVPFKVTASAQVINSDSPKGGITISFSKPVKVEVSSSSAPVKIYPPGSKIWNQNLKANIESKNTMAELWVDYWHKDMTHNLNSQSIRRTNRLFILQS